MPDDKKVLSEKKVPKKVVAPAAPLRSRLFKGENGSSLLFAGTAGGGYDVSVVAANTDTAKVHISTGEARSFGRFLLIRPKLRR